MLDGVDYVDAAGVSGFKVTSDKEVVVLYVTASWCPPCKAFTPMLVDMYHSMINKHVLDAEEPETASMPVEVVVVSVDANEDDMFSYMSEYQMPWLAAAYDDRPHLFGRIGEISEIPTVFVVDTKNSKVLSKNARNELLKEGVVMFDKWLAEARGQEWVDPDDPDKDHPYPLMKKLDSFKL